MRRLNCLKTPQWFEGVARAAAFWLVVLQAQAYQGEIHQQLTFVAAKMFNQCMVGTDIPRLSPLEARYMARTNARLADRNAFARIFNWRYYDRDDQTNQSVLWVIDTRFHGHFNEIEQRLKRTEDFSERYSELGRIAGYVQLVSSPAHTVPVYTARFWRFSNSDRFDRYPVDVAAVQSQLIDGCAFLEDQADDYADVLRSVATDTLDAVRSPIEGLPASWQAFWALAEEANRFGKYGPAGNNFGRKTEFVCQDGRRCVLLKDDPLYGKFASKRHASAVRGTMAVMLIMQRSLVTAELTDGGR